MVRKPHHKSNKNGDNSILIAKICISWDEFEPSFSPKGLISSNVLNEHLGLPLHLRGRVIDEENGIQTIIFKDQLR